MEGNDSGHCTSCQDPRRNDREALYDSVGFRVFEMLLVILVQAVQK